MNKSNIGLLLFKAAYCSCGRVIIFFVSWKFGRLTIYEYQGVTWQLYWENGLELGLWCLVPLSTIFQLFCGSQGYILEETEVPRENHWPAASDWQTWSDIKKMYFIRVKFIVWMTKRNLGIINWYLMNNNDYMIYHDNKICWWKKPWYLDGKSTLRQNFLLLKFDWSIKDDGHWIKTIGSSLPVCF